jgi:DNA polymerase-1
MIAVDIETVDPQLGTDGDGSIRGDGVILCVGLYDGRDYVCCTPDDPRLREWLASSEDKVFHNSVYDLSWIICGYNLTVGGVWHDTMTRAALIDEYADLDLDSCCKRFKVAGKNYADTLDKWFEANKSVYGLRGKVWSHADIIWMIPDGKEAMIRYNKQDCIATYNLWQAQEAAIKSQGLQEAYDIECRFMPIILEMKRNGIRIDPVARDQFTNQIENQLQDYERQLEYKYNITSETIASPKKLTIAMNALGIRSPVSTPSGGQSWAADALDLIDHPVVSIIQAAKNHNALLNKYLHGSLINSVVNGRIHCTFYPNKRDSGGTITGRLSSQNPNMQNIPAREDKHGQKSYGQEMRALFIPDQGCMLGAFDYSQIEYLLLAHYARGQQAAWFREQANNGVDFHTVAQNMTGIKSRDVVKRMNYGFIYGMGLNKLMTINRLLFKQLAEEAGMEILAFGKSIYEQYHSRLPVIKDTMNWAQQVTQQTGYIRSIGGRVHHKPRPVYENGRWNNGLYKMTNYLIQGSASEILKLGLIDAWDAGVFDVLRLHLTVHDENVVSIPYNKQGTDAARELQYLMEAAYKEVLLVPMKAVGEVGPTWGYWESDIWTDMQNNVFDRELVA